jgi:hypothetical protein
MPVWLCRFGVPGAGLIAFLGMSYLYEYGDRDLYEHILRSYGILPFQFPFVDISGSLAAWECARQGVDVILSDPCDVLHRGYNYSPLWMAASAIPLGVKDTTAIGWGLGAIFLLSLSLLPPPRRSLELVLMLGATFSTMVVFALERANPDILLFMLALGTGLSAEYKLSMRMLGYAVALLAALLKYYPIMALILVFGERKSIFVTIVLIVAGTIAVFWAQYHAEIVRGLPNIASGRFDTDLFAAKNLPFMVGMVFKYLAEPSTLAAPVGNIMTGGLYAALVAACVTFCRRMLRFGEMRATITSLPCRERILLVIGSAVIVGCFFGGQSIGYRGVFFLLVMPGLLAISRSSSRDIRNLSLGTSVVIVLLMWGECFRLAIDRGIDDSGRSAFLLGNDKILFWLIRELGWWWTVSIMLGVLTDFFSKSPIVRWLSPRYDNSVMHGR